MTSLLKALRLPAADKWLLMKTTALLTAIVIGLRVLPYRTMSRIISSLCKSGKRKVATNALTSRKVVWAVSHLRPYVPASTCLAEALATLVLLERNGRSGQLRFAVARSESGQLEAHAFVERENEILIGNLTDLSRYVTLSPAKEIIL